MTLRPYSGIISSGSRTRRTKPTMVRAPALPGEWIETELTCPTGLIRIKIHAANDVEAVPSKFSIVIDGMDGRFMSLEGDFPVPMAEAME